MRPVVIVLGVAAAVVLAAPVFGAEVVPVPQFRSVELRGGGAVTVMPGAAERVTIVEGNSRFTQLRVDDQGKLVIETCAVRCPINYRMHIEIRSRNVPILATRGGGAIDVAAGFAPQSELIAAVGGGGSIDTRAVRADTATAAVSGGGQIRLTARRSLTAAVRGGGLIRYWGNPQVTTAISGGGAVLRGR